MSRKTREEIVKEFRRLGLFDKDCKRFYSLSHQEKEKEFEAFCIKHNGYFAIVLSDEIICDDKELVLLAAKYGLWGGYHLISKRLLCDPEIALALAKCNRYEYSKIDKSLRDNPKLMLMAIKINPNIYCSLTAAVKADRDIVLEVAKKEPSNLKYLLKVKKELREPFQQDKELAIIMAENDPSILNSFFSENILADKHIQEIAFRLSDDKERKKRLLSNPWAFHYVDLQYWINDREFVKKALREDGTLLQLLPVEYRTDKELVLIAVRNNPDSLKYCDEKLLDDEEIILSALQTDSEEILQFASKRLRADYNLVFKAVTVDALNLQYAATELRDNRDIVLRAIKTYGGVLEDASERLQSDIELQRIASKHL